MPTFPHYRTAPPETIETDMGRAELIVSRGGSGMVSTLYRLRKPCVLVPRQVRYGAPSDEQVPFAKKWAALDMAILCMDVGDLGAAIEECRSRTFTFRTFPPLGDAIRRLVLGA